MTASPQRQGQCGGHLRGAQSGGSRTAALDAVAASWTIGSEEDGTRAASGLIVLADKGYAGVGEYIQIPYRYRGRGKPASQKEANRAHARLRSPGERADA